MTIKDVVKTSRLRITLPLIAVVLVACSGDTTGGDTTSTSTSDTVTTQVESSPEAPTTTITPTTSTLPATPVWPSEPSIVGYMTAVDQGPGFAVLELPSGISVGPATITIDEEIVLELRSGTPTSIPCELLGAEPYLENAPPNAPQWIFPCFVLVNARGSTIEQLHIFRYTWLTEDRGDSDPVPVLNGPIYEIRDGLALIETPQGVFTVPVAQEVDTTGCGEQTVETLLGSGQYHMYLNEAGQIEILECYGFA